MLKSFKALLIFFVPLWRLGWLFHRKLLMSKPKSVPIPVLLVGSLQIGGGGRTTVTMEISRQLSQRGVRHAILCHPLGSKGFTKHLKVDPSYSQSYSSPVSDEALLIARTMQAEVWISKNRCELIDILCDKFDAIIIDDGLEDPRLRNSYTIRICKDIKEQGRSLRELFPFGTLRSLASDHPEIHEVWSIPNSQPQFIQHQLMRSIHFRSGHPINVLGQTLDRHQWSTLVAGVGRFDQLCESLCQLGYDKIERDRRSDHDGNFEKYILQKYLSRGKSVVITPKDHVRMSSEHAQNPLIFVSSYTVSLNFPFDTFLQTWFGDPPLC